MGSLSAAARWLNLIQSAFSARIRELERHLGAVLFDRSGLRMRLTTHDSIILCQAARILALADEIEAFGGDQTPMRSLLRIGAADIFALACLPGSGSVTKRHGEMDDSGRGRNATRRQHLRAVCVHGHERAGVTRSMDGVVDLMGGTEAFASQSLLDTFNTVNDKLISLPFYNHARLLICRKDVLDELGLEPPPETWDDLVEALRAIRQIGTAWCNFSTLRIRVPPSTCSTLRHPRSKLKKEAGSARLHVCR